MVAAGVGAEVVPILGSSDFTEMHCSDFQVLRYISEGTHLVIMGSNYFFFNKALKTRKTGRYLLLS